MSIAKNLLALSPGIIAVIVIVAALVCIGVAVGVVIAVRRKNTKKGKAGLSVLGYVRPIASLGSGWDDDQPVVEEPVEEAGEEVAEAAEEPVISQPILVHKKAPEGKVFVRIRYNRSYIAKLIQAEETLKNYYTILRNEIMRYKVKDRISWRHETFRKGRKLLIKFALRGKTLNIYFALDPAQYAETKYKVKDVSSIARNAAVPTLYKIKNDRRCRYAKDLIAQVMAENGLVAGEEQNVDYAAQYPYEELEPLIERKLVKLLQWEETAEEAEESIIAVPLEVLPPEVAAAAAEIAEEIAEEEQPAEEPVEEVAEEPVISQPILVRRKAPEGKVFVRIRYNRSYIAKLIQAEETLKNYYTILRNEIMRYKVKDRISWRHETFRKGRKLLIRFALRGKTLNIYFALDPAQYAETKYKVKDVSSIARNAAVPTLYKIKNDRRCRYAKDLIAQVMAENGLVAGEEQNVDYAAQYPYEELEPLIERKLVKLLQWEEPAEEAEESVIAVPLEVLPPEVAAAAAEIAEEIAEEEQPAEEETEEAVEEEQPVEEETEEAVEEEQPVEEETEEVVEEEQPVEEETEEVVEEEQPVGEETEEVVEEEQPAEEEAEEAVEEQPVEDDDDFEDFFNEPEEEVAEETQAPESGAEVEISFEEAEEILDDKYVEAFVHQGNRYSDKTKKGIINVDVLGKYFDKGEKVTVEEIRKRVPGFGKKVTYIKVLGRGTLDKALTVEADDFTAAAIKMIVLTGGEVIRKKRT